MDKVVIYRDKLSKAFEGQVMATYSPSSHTRCTKAYQNRPNYEDPVPLVVIFHDP